MEKEKIYIQIEDDEEEIIKPPYWWVEYIDDCGYKHLATVKDETYLKYLQTNYSVISVKVIGE